ncbi:response regulator [Salinarimonas ramus]|uniref:Regulatory protein VirG n=1 Tax=Salinarimonas ramus TaxID=690164 RepID=A0A917V537_9HYPH|nr:response regulator [Salinarimonas ramus]GGK37817.1 DNA-binding response regulator [Salinarimonas ramus]
MTTGHRILVVDDEPAAREMVGDYLKMHGFDVALCDGGASLFATLGERRADLVVLDLNMPEEDGLSIVRRLKSATEAGPDLPVIMLTATASPIDRVVGLELGADDYLAKPCELRELVARIRSVLRRGGGGPATGSAAANAAPAENAVRFGTKWLHLDSYQLRDEDGGRLVLTRSEFALLKAFHDHPGRVLSRDRLLDLADARDPDAFDRSIDVRITRMRRKIEPDPARPRYIKTVRGAGYIYHPQGQED